MWSFVRFRKPKQERRGGWMHAGLNARVSSRPRIYRRTYYRADPLARSGCTPLHRRNFLSRERSAVPFHPRFTAAARKSSAGWGWKKGDGGRTRAINKLRGRGRKSVIPYRLCILERRLTIKEKFLLVLRFQPILYALSFSLANRMSPPVGWTKNRAQSVSRSSTGRRIGAGGKGMGRRNRKNDLRLRTRGR